MITSIRIDKSTAEQKAIILLGQYHAVSNVDAVLDGETWLVTAHISLFNKESVRKLRIDANTGDIVSWA